MTTTPVSFGGVALATTATTVGTVPSRQKWIIQKLAHFNSGSNASLVSVWLVPNGGTASDANKVARSTLMPGETWSCPDIERLTLDGGGTIQAAADPATVNAIGAALALT